MISERSYAFEAYLIVIGSQSWFSKLELPRFKGCYKNMGYRN